MLLTITGPSGSGKSTLVTNIRARNPEARSLESVTTRPPRLTDPPGEYRYASREEFEGMRERGEFLWDVPVHAFRFGTRKKAIEEALTGGFFLAVLIIEAVEKLQAYAGKIGKSGQMRSYYLDVADEGILRQRLKRRGDTPDYEERIAECRDWPRKARLSRARMKFINAAAKPGAVLDAVIKSI
jgi:guanylate kinase